MGKEQILLGHGSGGKLSHNLIAEKILPFFTNAELAKLDDAAVVNIDGRRVAFSTDSYVVDPIFFPGGDIGKIAVCGTVNDLAMMGAKPLFLSSGIIIEEGFELDHLQKILTSMRQMAEEAGVDIVTGDTKVVPRGAVDKIFINTSGIGLVAQNISVSGHNARIGDQIIINGPIADHGITVMANREGLEMDVELRTDSAPLNHLVQKILDCAPEVHVLRDPTRGGLATTLNEIAGQSGVGIELVESSIPVRDEVRGACELLGLDPFYIANEGKLIAVVNDKAADKILARMKQNTYGKSAAIIGRVTSEHPGRVVIKTPYGSSRILDMLSGELLPRIC